MKYVSFVIQPDVFSKQDFTGSPKHIKKHLLHRAESFNCCDYVRQAETQMGDTKLLAKLSGDMIARKHAIINTV